MPALEERSILHAPPIRLRREGPISILIDPERPHWVATDFRGEEILALVDGRRTLREIVNAYAERFSLEWPKAYLYCRTLLSDALQVGFLSETPIAPLPYPGRDRLLLPLLRQIRLEEIWLHITNRCNLACAHCLVESSPAGIVGEGTPFWEEAIDQAIALGAARFYVTGGEPFLREDLFDLLCRMTSAGEVVVLTNAIPIRGPRAERLAAMDRLRLHLQVSLDGATEKTNDAIRGSGCFEGTVAGIKQIQRAGFSPTVTFAVMEGNVAEMAAIVDLCATLEVKNLHFLWAHKRGRALAQSSTGAPPIDQVIRGAEEAIQRAEALGITIDNLESMKRRIAGRAGVKGDLTNAGYRSLCIYADGRVYPSAAFAGDAAFEMGNLRERPLEEIFRSPAWGPIRSATVIAKAGCRESDLRFIYGGGEPEQSYYHNGSLDGDDPYRPLHERLVLLAIDRVAEEKLRLATPSGYDRPILFAAMGEGAMDESEPVYLSPSACVLSLDAGLSRETVRDFYAEAAQKPASELCCPTSGPVDDLSHIPPEVLELSYGCGSPVSAADLASGETLVDLGSGGGIDCFIAAKKVGPEGRVIGIDMTEEMLAKAHSARPKVAERLGYDVVEFRRGYLESIPVEEGSADVVTSNCVINLSPNKPKVFAEAWRILKDHGRLVVSDTISARRLPDAIRTNPRLWGECVSGALTEEGYFALLEQAGFYGLSLLKKSFWKEVAGERFFSIIIRGYKFGKKAGCRYVGQKAIYLGPFAATMDEEGHLFLRNVPLEVCTDTAAKLSNPPYHQSFVILGPEGDESAVIPEGAQADSPRCAPGCC